MKKYTIKIINISLCLGIGKYYKKMIYNRSFNHILYTIASILTYYYLLSSVYHTLYRL